MGDLGILFIIILFAGFIFVMRLIGAWMLRINEVINELQAIKELLKKQNNS